MVQGSHTAKLAVRAKGRDPAIAEIQHPYFAAASHSDVADPAELRGSAALTTECPESFSRGTAQDDDAFEHSITDYHDSLSQSDEMRAGEQGVVDPAAACNEDRIPIHGHNIARLTSGQ